MIDPMNEILQTVLLTLAIFCLGIFAGYCYGTRTFRQEAVEAGAAAWCVVDTAGRVEFRWKAETCKEENNE